MRKKTDDTYDQAGKRHVSTRQTLAAAKSFQAQKIAELQRHRETKFDLDDRECSAKRAI
jgi:hypothetical protein